MEAKLDQNDQEQPEKNNLPTNQKLGLLFSVSATKFYFVHLPKENADLFYDNIIKIFSGENPELAETALRISASMWKEDFKPIQNDLSKGLFSPKLSTDYPGFELDSTKVLDKMISRGERVLSDPEESVEFFEWFKNLENILDGYA